MTILRNSFINEYRRNAKRKVLLDTQEDQYVMDQADSLVAKNDGIRQFVHNDIHQAIAKLPESLRTAYELNIQGFKYQEIADELNVPIGTVKTRIFIARRKLRTMLNEYEVGYKLKLIS